MVVYSIDTIKKACILSSERSGSISQADYLVVLKFYHKTLLSGYFIGVNTSASCEMFM